MWDCQFNPDDFDWENDEVKDAPVPSVYDYETDDSEIYSDHEISCLAETGISQLMQYLRR